MATDEAAVTMQDHVTREPRQPWRWMILFARFFWTFIGLGTFKSLGVFIPYFMESFSTNTAVAGVASSAVCGVGLLTTGPFVGSLMKVWSPRKLTIVGGAVAAFCIFAASFSSSITQFAVWLSLSSVGLAFVQVATVQPLMDYFPDDFAFANGLSLAGGTIGMMTVPPLMEYLVDLYGWRRAFGLLGAFTLNYVVCGALLRPVDKTKMVTQYSLVESGPDVDTTPTTSRQLKDGEVSDKITETEKSMSVFNTILENLRERFDTKLLTEPLFLVYQVVSVFEGMTYSMWHLFLIPQGVELGFGDAPSAFLATFGGLGSLIGRLGHGTVVDRGIFKASSLFILSSLVFAASNSLDPLAVSSYTAMAALASISGVAIGIIYPLTFVLMREIIGDRHMSAYGWLFVTHGAGLLIGGLFAGWIHDVTGHYEFVFVAIGGIAVTMATTVAFMRCMMYCFERKNRSP